MNILSFDIEDWFHIFDSAYCNKPEKWEKLPSSVGKNTSWVLDLLAEYNLKATFFCLGWVAEKHPQLIKNISDGGHEVAAHSFVHNKVYLQDNTVFKKDTERVIKHLQDLTGKPIDTYRAPGFSLNKNTLWAFEILYELGIRSDSSLKSNLHMGFPGRIPNQPFLLKCNGFSVKEFPIRTFNFLGDHVIYSGSGYFRLWPYWFVKNRFKKSAYEMVYFHPRDFDSSIHKMFKTNPYLQLRYRIGTSRSRTKMRYFLNDFEFQTLHQAEKNVDWEKAPVLDLTNPG